MLARLPSTIKADGSTMRRPKQTAASASIAAAGSNRTGCQRARGGKTAKSRISLRLPKVPGAPFRCLVLAGGGWGDENLALSHLIVRPGFDAPPSPAKEPAPPPPPPPPR